jgi:hypothetical protein
MPFYSRSQAPAWERTSRQSSAFALSPYENAQLVKSDEMFRQKVDYIHHNPVRIGLVDRPED